MKLHFTHGTEASLKPKTTTYVIERTGCTVSVDGFEYIHDAYGGNLSKAGKATGAAFWEVSNLLMDYICFDCPLLQPDWKSRRALYRNDASDSTRRVVELGCGLGLVGIVAASLLDDADLAVLTDGDGGVVDMARASLAKFADQERARDSNARICNHRAAVLQWDSDEHTRDLNDSTCYPFSRDGLLISY